MKLIDADDFIAFMNELEAAGAENVSFNDLRHLMEKQPTAYDVEAVVREMKKKSRKMSTVAVPHTYYRAIGTNVCESIIRSGGIG